MTAVRHRNPCASRPMRHALSLHWVGRSHLLWCRRQRSQDNRRQSKPIPRVAACGVQSRCVIDLTHASTSPCCGEVMEVSVLQ